MAKICKLPFAYEIAFAIRDDDISYFTAPQMLDKIYRKAWERGFKVSLAIVPMHKGTNNPNVPPNFRKSRNYFPIYKNEALVFYLSNKLKEGQIGLMLHGFCHAEKTNHSSLIFDFRSGLLKSEDNKKIDLIKYSEFYGMGEENINKRIKLGKRILERTFNTKINIFVAPQEYLTDIIWNSLSKNKLDYCGSVSKELITKILIRSVHIRPLIDIIIKKSLGMKTECFEEDIIHLTDIVFIPASYRHYWNKHLDNSISDYWLNQFKLLFDRKKEGYLILLTHYWEYFYDWDIEITQQMQYAYLEKILDFVDSNPRVWKCTIPELVNWIHIRDNIKIDNSLGGLKVYSRYNAKGLAIRLNNKETNRINKKQITLETVNDSTFAIVDIKAGQTIDLYE